MSVGVLFVSPELQDAYSLTQMLAELSIALEHSGTLADAGTKLLSGCFQVVLTEAELADGTWLDILRLARQLATPAEVVVTRANVDARFWAEAINMGAYDLLVQPFHGPEVRRILTSASARVSPAATVQG